MTTFSKIYLFPIFFLILLVTNIQTAQSVEYAVPNNGSPYMKFDSLKEGQILHIPTGLTVTLEQMLDSISSSKVIYVAETHDNVESHKVQMEIIKKLQSRMPGKIAVGMEMFRRPAQKDIDRWINGELSQSDFYMLWHENWGAGYENYHDILEFIKKNRIPLIALKPDKDIESAFRSKGIDGLSDSEREMLPEMDETDKYHKIFAGAIFGGHTKNTHAVLKRPYQTLLLWEETMAESIVNFLKSPQGKDKKMIVLTGSFHVEYGFGVPKRTYKRMPHNYSTVLPVAVYVTKEIKEERLMEVESTAIPLYVGDYIWTVKYTLLEKSKIILGVSIKTGEQGLNIVSVDDNSNAMTAGIRPDDIIISMDNHPVKSIPDLKALLKTKKIGDHANIKLIRDKKELIVDVQFRKY